MSSRSGDSFDHLLPLLRETIRNADALAFCLALWEIIQVWDDCEDGAQPDRARAHMAFTSLLTLWRNPFYRSHAADLTPIIESCILQWTAANVLDKGDESDREKSFMLRAPFYQVLAYCAYLCNGMEHAASVAPLIHRLYGERIQDFHEEMSHA